MIYSILSHDIFADGIYDIISVAKNMPKAYHT